MWSLANLPTGGMLDSLGVGTLSRRPIADSLFWIVRQCFPPPPVTRVGTPAPIPFTRSTERRVAESDRKSKRPSINLADRRHQRGLGADNRGGEVLTIRELIPGVEEPGAHYEARCE